jgi:hypothetical protein
MERPSLEDLGDNSQLELLAEVTGWHAASCASRKATSNPKEIPKCFARFSQRAPHSGAISCASEIGGRVTSKLKMQMTLEQLRWVSLPTQRKCWRLRLSCKRPGARRCRGRPTICSAMQSNSFLLANGDSQDWLRRRMGHDLRKAARRVIAAKNDPISKIVADHLVDIELLNHYYLAKELEYRVTGSKTYPPQTALSQFLQQIIPMVEPYAWKAFKLFERLLHHSIVPVTAG